MTYKITTNANGTKKVTIAKSVIDLNVKLSQFRKKNILVDDISRAPEMVAA